MTQTPSFPLLDHPAFRGVSEASVTRLEGDCRVLRFELGGQLSDSNNIAARILVILQGQARLLGRHHGRLTTVGKYGPGSVIGAASLLCGAPCENAIAAEEVIACAISDELWCELYASEASFRQWCDQQLWPQELLKLLEALEQTTPEADSSALEKLENALQSAERCSPDQVSVDAALAAGGKVIGIIPGVLDKKEVLHPDITETIRVADLFQRKAKMIEVSEIVFTKISRSRICCPKKPLKVLK